jgi:hypothetical protein
VTTIQLGDIVTWRSAKHPASLGIQHCEVIAFGKTDDELEAATLRVFGQEVNALVSDLTKEPQ